MACRGRSRGGALPDGKLTRGGGGALHAGRRRRATLERWQAVITEQHGEEAVKAADAFRSHLKAFAPHKATLLRYLGGEDKKRGDQAAALREVQRFCFGLGFPDGMIENIFLYLYDADIIPEEAFTDWREDTDETVPGKTTALVKLNRFFEWLDEAEEEDEDDE